MLLAFVRFEADTNEVPGGVDEVLLREQTVLRIGVARSEDARDAAASRRGRHEEDGAVGTLGLRQGAVPSRVPSRPGFTDRLGAGPKIVRAGALGKEGCTRQTEDSSRVGKRVHNKE